jgi:hypothetical protein
MHASAAAEQRARRVLRIERVPRRRSNTEGLGVGFPKAALYTVSAAAELVEHHPGRARVHSVVPIESPHRVESAIHVVDTIIHDNNRVAILNSIFGHGLISAALDFGEFSPLRGQRSSLR